MITPKEVRSEHGGRKYFSFSWGIIPCVYSSSIGTFWGYISYLGVFTPDAVIRQDMHGLFCAWIYRVHIIMCTYIINVRWSI